MPTPRPTCSHGDDARSFRVPSSEFRVAFTLIELLVVVAIIVALLAILMPSMGKAVEMAQLAKCGSNLKQTAVGHFSRAVDSNGRFAYYGFNKPTVFREGGVDARADLNRYIPLNDLMCPFNERIDYINPPIPSSPGMEWTYVWYAGWRHDGEAKGLDRPGDHFTIAGRRVSVIAADQLWTQIGGQFPHSSHPGRGFGMYTAGANTGPVAVTQPYDPNIYTFIRWQNQSGNFQAGGSTDLNFAFSDGAVKLYPRVTAATTELTLVSGFRAASIWYIYLPTH